MDVFDNVIDVTATCIDAVVLCIILCNSYMQKYKKFDLFGKITFVIMFQVTIFFNNNVFLQFIVIMILGGLYSYIFLEGRVREKIIICLVYNIFLILINSILISCFVLFFNMPLEKLISEANEIKYMLIIIDKTLIIILVMLYLFKAKKIFFEKKEAILLVMVFGISMFVFMMNLQFVYMERSNPTSEFFILCISVALFFIDIISVFLIFQIEKEHEKSINARILISEMAKDRQTIEKINNIYEHTRKIRHDLKHYLIAIDGLIKSNEINKAQNIIETILDNQLKNTYIIYSEDVMINSVICEKQNKCEMENIPLDIIITGIIKVNSDKMIIIAVMLSNILDNAIESQKNTNIKKIELKMCEIGDMYIISVKNNIDNSVLETNPKLITSKDKMNHGIGIGSIKDAVIKIDGDIKIREENNQFIVEVVFENE